jgi:uncharacterized protein (TIGR02271 family)
MTLQKLKDFDQNYSETFAGDDIIGMNVYTDITEEKVGTVSDVLLDEEGHFRYLVIDLGFWIFGKKVLLPIGVSRIDYNRHCVYARGMNKEQAENLPEFSENINSDYDYEEQVRKIYRKPSGLEASLPLESSKVQAEYAPSVAVPNSYDRNTYKYEEEPSLYEINDQDHQTLKLYQERLIANKNRLKTGEVAIGKQVKSEISQVSVPVDKERVIIERTTPANAGVAVPASENAFREGEVARMELHEETADVRKEAFVREEVTIRKEVEQDTVNVQETVRREELDIDTDGNPIVKESR